jgi:hypothetical protein
VPDLVIQAVCNQAVAIADQEPATLDQKSFALPLRRLADQARARGPALVALKQEPGAARDGAAKGRSRRPPDPEETGAAALLRRGPGA